MASNNQIKFLKSLASAKFRQKYNNFIAEGDKLVNEILKSGTFEVEGLYATSNWLLSNETLISSTKVSTFEVDQLQMKQISQLTTPSEVYCLLKKGEENVKVVGNSSHIILLDGVQDPGNVGTIIRICDWFGIRALIGTSKTADFYHP